MRNVVFLVRFPNGIRESFHLSAYQSQVPYFLQTQPGRDKWHILTITKNRLMMHLHDAIKEGAEVIRLSGSGKRKRAQYMSESSFVVV